MSWLQIKNIIILKCRHLLLYTVTTKHFSDCDMQWKVDFVQKPAMNSSVAGLRSSKALPKDKIVTKKWSWSPFGGLQPIWSTTAFWILVKPLHLRSMLSKSVRCMKNCMPTARIGQQEEPMAHFFPMTVFNHMLHNQDFKTWTNWAIKFCLICTIHLTSHQPTTNSSSILTTFCRENASTTRRMQKMLSKSSSNPEVWFLCYRNKQTYFLLAKMCWL